MGNYNPEIMVGCSIGAYVWLCYYTISILFIDEGRSESLSNDCPIDFDTAIQGEMPRMDGF